MNEERNETKYYGRYLGCKINQKKDGTGEYGLVSIAYHGVKSDDGTPWFTVQDQAMPVEKMKEVCEGIPFDSKVEILFLTGLTPGGKQRILKLTVVED